MNHKNTVKSKNRRFQRPGLMFYCYLLIPLNELTRNIVKINQLKKRKKIIDISGVSIQNAGKGIFCHLDVRRDLIEAWLRMPKSDLSQAQDDNHYEKNRVSSKLACSFPCYRLIPLNELARNTLKINKIKNEKKSLILSIDQSRMQERAYSITNYELQI